MRVVSGGSLPANRFRLGGLGGVLIAGVSFWWMVTNGTFNLDQEAFSSNFYDVQAQAMLHGRLSMPSSVLSIEGITAHGGTYMYFGPLLAVVRLPLIWADPSLTGRISATSMLLAFLVGLWALIELGWRLRPLAGLGERVGGTEQVVVGLLTASVGIGSILLYLSSYVSVYHETELWAVALALWGLVCGYEVLTRPRLRPVLALAALTVACTMTRLAVGLGLVALSLLVSLCLATNAGPLGWLRHRFALEELEVSPAMAGVLGAGAVVTLALYSWINEAKFGTLVTLPLSHQGLATDDLTPSYYLFAHTHTSFNGLGFVPSTLAWYLSPGAISPSRLFPYLNFPAQISVIGHTAFAELTPSSSLPATMPLLCLFALGGIVGLVAPRRLSSEEASTLLHLRPLVLATLVGWIGALSYAVIANRYLGDFFPTLSVCALAGTVLLVRHRRVLAGLWRPILVVGCALGLAYSCWANLALGLMNQRVVRASIPLSERVHFATERVRLFHAIDNGPTPEVTWGGKLPVAGPTGRLYVTPGCSSIFQYDSSTWVALGRTARAGHYLVALDLRHAPLGVNLPLLVAGTPGNADAITVVSIPNHRFIVRYLAETLGVFFNHRAWLTSLPQQIPASGWVHLDLTMDTSLKAPLRTMEVATEHAVLLDQPLAIGAHLSTTVGAVPPQLTSDRSVTSVIAPTLSIPSRWQRPSIPLCQDLRR